MIRLIVLSFFIYSGAAHSSSVEHSLICKEADQGSESASLALSFEGGTFSLDNADRGCRSDYVVRETSGAANNVIIFSYPTSDNMGLNAQLMVFSAPAKGGKANYIGDIPANASESENGTYKDVQQSGGSIYESVYRIDDSKVVTLTPGKELIVSGEQCIYKENSDIACKKMRGSFKKPVCVFNYGERKVLADTKECAGMSESL
ncbi:hypothetical protein [Pseudomonas sp. Irchel 3E19]|uniref:hypothetical protein n=1 Tax=Pseudomonas sp. Irchel 3E19 TaxID=2008981 RepID=UPI000BA3E3DA|nr:hypothetical protein [Pseudomonas sp. Irchel 3E19]